MSFAVVNYVHIDEPNAAATATREVVLPRLQSLEGFEHAVFLADATQTRGFSVMVFDTESHARAMAERLSTGAVVAPPGLTFEKQEVFEVVATTT